MLCSNCSRVVQPIVAIDIDGTLGDYHSHFLRFAESYLGLEPEEDRWGGYTGRPGFRDWFTSEYIVDTRTWYDIKLAYRQGAQKRSMPVFHYANQLTREMQLLGAEIWLTTTRPYLRLDSVDPDTRFWLRNNDIKYDALLYDDNKYDVLASRVDSRRVVAVIDDQHDELEKAAINFGTDACLLSAGWYNRAWHHMWKRDRVCFNLSDASWKIGTKIEEWSERADSSELPGLAVESTQPPAGT